MFWKYEKIFLAKGNDCDNRRLADFYAFVENLTVDGSGRMKETREEKRQRKVRGDRRG